MKILVTGAEGQLVRSLAERATELEDVELIALGRPTLDLAVEGSAASAIDSIKPQLVINAAAYTAVDRAEDEPELAFRVNSEAAGEVAAAAARVGAAVVQVSTDYVFNGRSDRPYDEDSPTDPLGVYGRSKLEGEERVRAANPRHAIVRTAWVYSPFAGNFVKTMMNAARTRDELTVVADQVGSPTSALDLADGILRLATSWAENPDHGLGEIYHLAGTGQTSWFGLADFVMDECRKLSVPAAEVKPIPTSAWPTRATRPASSVLDSSKFAQTFGYAAPAWQDSASAVVGRLAAQAS